MTVGFNSPRVLLERLMHGSRTLEKDCFNSPRVLLEPDETPKDHFAIVNRFNSPRVLLELEGGLGAGGDEKVSILPESYWNQSCCCPNLLTYPAFQFSQSLIGTDALHVGLVT